MAQYAELLEEVQNIGNAHRSKARRYIPKMYWALRNENPNHTPEDARDRIEKDCLDIWSKRTILDALPDEAKDLKKQKAGRLGQKEANSAAVSAAPEKKKEEEIIIDTQGKPIENATTTQPLTTTKTTVADSVQTCSNNVDNFLQFELSLSPKDVWGYMFREYLANNKEDPFWINGILNKGTGKVISASIGRLSQLE
jgi:hypothetical protein